MAIRRTPGPTAARTRRTLCLIAPRSTTARVARCEESHELVRSREPCIMSSRYRSTCRGEPVTTCERADDAATLDHINLRRAVCVWPPAVGWSWRPARRQAQETPRPGTMSHHDAGPRAWACVPGGTREPAMEQGTPLAQGWCPARCLAQGW